LSRHVGTNQHEESLDPEAVSLEQAKDKFCHSLKPGTYSSKSEFFYELGLVYRRRPDDRHQLLGPETLVIDVIKENYDPVFIAHSGFKRTCDLIALSFWWPGIRKSIGDYIRRCKACQKEREDQEFKAHWRG
jgi:hypothetical protein